MKIQKFLIIGLVAFCLTACSNDGGAGDKSVEVETSSATTTITTTSPVVTTTTITVGSEPEIITTTPSTSLTQGTTSKVTTTTKTTTTKKPATVTTTKKTTTKTTTTTKKTTTTVKTTTKATTTTAYVPFSKPVEFVYDETNDVYRATMNDGSIIAYKYGLYGQLHILAEPNNSDNTEGRTPYSSATCPLELTLKGKTSNGKFYYATAVWGSSRKTYSGYIPVDISCFIDVYFDYDAAYEIFELVNKERAKAGVPALKYDYNLEKYAMFRSSELYIAFQHGGTAETSEEHNYICQNYVYTDFHLVNENIYQLRCDNSWTKYELPSAAKINQCWVDSSGHYGNMINSEKTHIGIGVYRCEKGTFAVQVFAKANE